MPQAEGPLSACRWWALDDLRKMQEEEGEQAARGWGGGQGRRHPAWTRRPRSPQAAAEKGEMRREVVADTERRKPMLQDEEPEEEPPGPARAPRRKGEAGEGRPAPAHSAHLCPAPSTCLLVLSPGPGSARISPRRREAVPRCGTAAERRHQERPHAEPRAAGPRAGLASAAAEPWRRRSGALEAAR